MRHAILAGLLLTSVAAAGCGPSTSACDGSCPSIAGTYAVTTSSLVGSCGFTPWLLGPTVTLQQSAGSGTVTFDVIDPVEQLEVPLSALVRVPNDGGSVADVQGLLRTQRESMAKGPIVELQLLFDGAISQTGSRRVLSGTLDTEDVLADGCVTAITFEATETPTATP